MIADDKLALEFEHKDSFIFIFYYFTKIMNFTELLPTKSRKNSYSINSLTIKPQANEKE